MTDSYKIKNSVFEWSKTIEMKKFVDDGMLLQMKIPLTIWQHKNTSTTRTNGGFIQISKVLIPCHWGIVLISSKHLSTLQRLQQEAGEEPHLPIYSYKPKQRELAQSSSSTWWNWQGSWWSSCKSGSQEGGEPSLEWTVWPVTKSIWQNSSKLAFTNSIYFVTVGSFTADVGLLSPTGGVKTTPRMTRFSPCKSVQ